MYPDSLKNLIESFENFPGIGEKTAERMAFSVLSFDEDKFKLLQENLEDVKISLDSVLLEKAKVNFVDDGM